MAQHSNRDPTVKEAHDLVDQLNQTLIKDGFEFEGEVFPVRWYRRSKWVAHPSKLGRVRKYFPAVPHEEIDHGNRLLTTRAKWDRRNPRTGKIETTGTLMKTVKSLTLKDAKANCRRLLETAKKQEIKNARIELTWIVGFLF